MMVAADAIASKLPHLPESPGVYLWKDADGLEVEYSVAIGNVPAEGEAGPQLSRERMRIRLPEPFSQVTSRSRMPVRMLTVRS